ncbi:SEC7-like, alpha orthogonal bundle [Penicillium griseofulvum]|uniref:SEC7-like, alpha orthogonal bundle n=1 Tax=Penicillium patulum TaxID=5078 RepID=A0A135LKA9_PENPA|nr:SEC7-like, alpha orthogonal bundle [Penicillium griseofulvum]KXG49415.1 SEC7-like, alpha orthogonal bundle [Penicillium griseofulvum]
MSQQRETYSPPRTPPSQTARYRPSKRGYPTRPSIRDAFPDAMDNPPRTSESGDDRDPHDLSLSPQHATRTSIVDNMLLSLDQFAPSSSILDDYRLFNSAFEIDNSHYSQESDSHGRYRGHTFSSSMSSEPDYGYEDGNSRYATITATKGRRSNSSSNHQTTPRQMGSSRGGTGTMPRTNTARNGSKGSSSSIADYSYTVPRARTDQGLDRRSASFDCGPKRAFAPYTDSVGQESTLYDDHDAAPTPSVPAGPRKAHDYNRTPTATSARTPIASRRNSMKSAHAPQVRKVRPENIGTGTLRARDNDFQDVDETELDLPPAIPASLDPPAPSPTISYNKPAFPPPEPTATTTISTNVPINHPAPSTKERPGFFRRVFGSKTPAPGPADTSGINANLSHLQDTESRDNGATASLKGRPAQGAKSSAGVSPSSVRTGPHQVVNKKPSFFRRRKRSVPDHAPPPIVIPQHLAPQTMDTMAAPSPVSSLRQVMNPYLDEELDRKENADWEVKIRQPGFLQTQKKRESVSAPGAPKAKTSLQPSAASHDQDLSPVAEKDRTSNGDVSTDFALQEKSQNVAASATLSPVAEDFSRAIKSNVEVPQIDVATLALPSEDVVCGSPVDSMSASSNYQTAANTPLIEQEELQPVDDSEDQVDGPGEAVEDGPTAADREQAQRLFDSQDQVVGNESAAAWLGDPDRAMVREAYMRLYNWSNLNIVASLRALCDRLVLKGETQQVDRVLDAFSTRWCDCNPSHGFKATDVVHTICYSILLLNTDLHLADIDSKMTKSQFVRNTMPTIHRVAMDSAPEKFETLRPINRSKTQQHEVHPAPTSARSAPTSARSATFPSELTRSSFDKDADANVDAGPLVNTPFTGTVRAWEQQVEAVLKDFYTSIQKERLPLFGAQPEREVSRMSSNNFLGPSSGTLRRSPSTISKSGSDIFPRGRSANSSHGAARWSSKPRSRAGRLYPPSMMGSSRTSLDDQSVSSPTGSSTWSKYSLGKFTSASVDSFGSDFPRGEYQQSIGFANALSQAIIREDSATSVYSYEEPERTTPLLEDDTLALAGAPWAKEGSLKHKHHLDAVDKRAKDRNWNDCFAVIQQGWMRLFSFNNSTKSMRQKSKQRGGVIVGGGNWTENAEELWKFMLRQTIASALPSPGYSKSRPHVWALSLPTGAVHLFQAGTPEIVREFVSTANYWSARLSKQPLVGGISNIEYGWSDSVINSALIGGESRSPPPSSGARPSIQSSIRSSVDHQGVRPRLPADRVNISDWSPPQQSMVASNLTEEEQWKALQAYVQNVEDDLSRHNELRPAMNLAFSPRHPNAAKAMANWERKSSYLLREIVKFRTYIDSLRNAISSKERIFASNAHSQVDENPIMEPTEAV